MIISSNVLQDAAIRLRCSALILWTASSIVKLILIAIQSAVRLGIAQHPVLARLGK